MEGGGDINPHTFSSSDGLSNPTDRNPDQGSAGGHRRNASQQQRGRGEGWRRPSNRGNNASRGYSHRGRGRGGSFQPRRQPTNEDYGAPDDYPDVPVQNNDFETLNPQQVSRDRSDQTANNNEARGFAPYPTGTSDERRRGNGGGYRGNRDRDRKWLPPTGRGRGNGPYQNRNTGKNDYSRRNLNPDARPFQPESTSTTSNAGLEVSQRSWEPETAPGYPEVERKNRENPSVSRGTRRVRNERRGRGGGGPSHQQNFEDDDDGSTSQFREENQEEEVRDATVDKPKASQGKPKNQREVLMDQLSRNVYECMVCCEKVRFSQPVWSCKRCFNVFHFWCIRKWASSSSDETGGWRCPGCQSNYDASPDGYYCFCGKTKNPKSSRYDVPHTCGQVCGKDNPGGLNCTHTCNAQCHPGPCPSCEVQQTRYCGCGKTHAQVLCGSKVVLTCANACSKSLACGVHQCTRSCHFGECATCEEKLIHKCHCGAEQKDVGCTREANSSKVYACTRKCKNKLSCGQHVCEKICHPGPCGPCKTSIEAILSCPCGQTPISDACAAARMPIRRKCTDPIPTCGKTCLRVLPCGNMNEKHHCRRKCHLEIVCPPCQLISSLKCRCGSKDVEIPCVDLSSQAEITCGKKCNKKKSCGKHKCNTKCCIDMDHVCPILCQRQLRCGNHTCSNLCHLNPCPPCDIASFDELACECGASIIYPPVPCGTRRPPCHLPCSRQHSCDHEVHHPCHSETNCPPCTVLTAKWCHGKHELRKNIMCHITHFSCGLPCGKVLSCGRHPCPKTCHSGSCLENGEICKLSCVKPKDCGHKCGAACHGDACPTSKCKVMTDVVCPCGRRTDTMICWKRDIEYDRTVTWEYHQELKKLEPNCGDVAKIDEETKTNIMAKMKETIPKSNVLECDKECAKLERNRKLAEALQLENVDVTTSIGTPNYSEFLTKFTKKNPQFVEMIHKQLTDLVIKAKQSRKKNETYGFNSMNRDKRHVVHEYSDFFGVMSESFDEEPNRNVVCFASKEKSYLPSVSLVDAVFRPAIRSERLRPNDDVTFRPEKRTQIVGPSNWSMKPVQTPKPSSSSQSEMVTLNNPGLRFGGSASSDFPPL